MTEKSESPEFEPGDWEKSLPETPEELFIAFMRKSDEVRDASHRLANRLHEGTLALGVMDQITKRNRRKRWLITALTFVVTLWTAAWAIDWHVESCAVFGRPSPNTTSTVLFWEIEDEAICNVTFPFHDHGRDHRLVEDPFLRQDVETVIEEWIERNPDRIRRMLETEGRP